MHCFPLFFFLVDILLNLSVHMCVYTHARMCVCERERERVCAHVHEYVYMCVCVCMYVHTHKCIYVCLCAHLCVTVNGEIHHGNGGHCNSHMVVDNGPVEPEEDNSLIIQYLSTMPPPKVNHPIPVHHAPTQGKSPNTCSPCPHPR